MSITSCALCSTVTSATHCVGPHLISDQTVQQLGQVLEALPLIRQLASPRHDLRQNKHTDSSHTSASLQRRYYFCIKMRQQSHPAWG